MEVFMHVAVMQDCAILAAWLLWQRYKKLKCVHGVVNVAVAFIAFVVLAVIPCFFAELVLEQFHGLFCPVSSFFIASRISIVQYWAYCQAQFTCTCKDIEKKTK